MPMDSSSWGLTLAIGATLCGVTACVTPALAQENQTMPPNTGLLSFAGGVDFVTQYVFRGITQENQGLIAQPYGNVTAKLYESTDGPIQNISINAGIWNSMHEARTFSDGAWYEADLSLGASVTTFERLTTSVAFIWYTYPDSNPRLDTISELDLKLAFNDSGLWFDVNGLPFSVQPYLLLAIETDNPGRRAAGFDDGIYCEVGLAPSIVVPVTPSLPLTLSLPMAVGLSIRDYYPDPLTAKDETFGYFAIGFKISAPLFFIPARYGTWSVYAGVTGYFLGDNAAATVGPAGVNLTGGSKEEVVGSFGLSINY